MVQFFDGSVITLPGWVFNIPIPLLDLAWIMVFMLLFGMLFLRNEP